MANENEFLIKTNEQSFTDMHKFLTWMDDNFITWRFSGVGEYWINGKGDATMAKLVWGK